MMLDKCREMMRRLLRCFSSALLSLTAALSFVAAVLLAGGCAQREWAFVHMTDTQIGFHDPSEGFLHSDTLMQRAVEAANALAPDLVFITGDMVDDAASETQNAIFERNLASLRAPVWYLPGNHDIRGFTPERHDAYVALRGYDRFSFRHKGCAFIGIDSNCIKDGDAAAEAEQWNWLTKQLRSARSARYIFVFLHCPIVRESIDEPEDYFNFSIPRRERYLRLFKDAGVDAVFAGHTHCPYQTEIDGIAFYTGTAVGNCLNHGRPGFNLVRITRKGLQVTSVPTTPDDSR